MIETTTADCALLAALTAPGRQRERAVAELYERYGQRFQRYFERHRVNPAEAEELVQEVFIKIVRGVESYRGDAPPSAWLWSIARNTLTSHVRQSTLDTVSDADLDLENLLCTDAQDPEAEELVDCVRRQFLQFAERHADRAQALSLLAFHGWKPKELADYLGRTAAATREYLSQCRKLLQPFLAPCHELLAAD